MEVYREIERSIITKYRRKIWRPFTAAVQQYRLIQEGDRIAVCLSGGKDSMLLAKCMQELQRYGHTRFELSFLVMDPGYAPANRRLIQDNAEALHVPIHLFETDIFEVVARVETSPCYLCARMRRGHLYKNARELGCNKIALGHHFDDVIETTLLSMLYAGEIRTMMPKLHSTNFPGMQLIRPLYHVREADILAWKRYNRLDFLQCACRLTEKSAADVGESKRMEVKQLIRTLKEVNPSVEANIFRSLQNVGLDTVLGYTSKGVRHTFLEGYGDTPSF